MRSCRGRQYHLRLSARPKRHGENGLTLLETLITMVLLTVAMVGITGSIAATQRVAAITQDQSRLEVAMRQLSDFVRDSTSAGLGYQTCTKVTAPVTAGAAGTTTGTYATQIGALAKPPGVKQWGLTAIALSTNGTHDTNSNIGAVWTTGCPVGQGDYGVQKITLSVFDSAGTRSISRTVWKSVGWCYQGALQPVNPAVTTC